MRSLRTALGPALERPEVMRTARAYRVMRRWPEIVGNLLATKSICTRYDGGVVSVVAVGSAWAQEIRMMKDTILGRMREMAREPGLFADLHVGVTDQTAFELLEPPAPPPPPLNYDGMTIAQIRERRLRILRGESVD